MEREEGMIWSATAERSGGDSLGAVGAWRVKREASGSHAIHQDCIHALCPGCAVKRTGVLNNLFLTHGILIIKLQVS